MNIKTSTYMALGIAAAVSLLVVNSLGTQAFAYKDRDHDDHKDLKQTIYCLKHHGGGDVSSHYYYRCGEKYLEKV
jgi:hypothetical protein